MESCDAKDSTNPVGRWVERRLGGLAVPCHGGSVSQQPLKGKELRARARVSLPLPLSLLSLCVKVCACPSVRARVCGRGGGGSRVSPKSSDSIRYSFLSLPTPVW